MKRILVAMSGGLDSSAAAFLLQKKGYDVAGAFMRLCNEGISSSEEDAHQVAKRLNIPFYVFDLRKEFKECVIDYFAKTYAAGFTPNPCVMCNKRIKFDLFFRQATERGYESMATGHYVHKVCNNSTGLFELHEAKDESKDQSYFLFLLSQEQLAACEFPLSQYTKEHIKDLAHEHGYVSGRKKESQEICFIPNDDYVGYLESLGVVTSQKGEIKDTTGRICGYHKGFFKFTVGQRRGIGVSAKEPLYVVRINSEANEVIIGKREEVTRHSFTVKDIHWISEEAPSSEFEAFVRVRYNQQKQRATLRLCKNCIEVKLLERPDVISPGQAAVFYDDNVVLGGGWIEK